MKKKLKYIVITIIFIFLICNNTIVHAFGFADYDDATADSEANKEISQQQEKIKETVNKSSNNYLSSLKVESHKFTQNFEKQTIQYSIDEQVTENYIEVTATADDNKATITGTGKINLSNGENNIRIDVTAENGSVRAYFIKIVKSSDTNANETISTNILSNSENSVITNSVAENKNINNINNKNSNNGDNKNIIILIILVVIIIILFLFSGKNKKKRRRR